MDDDRWQGDGFLQSLRPLIRVSRSSTIRLLLLATVVACTGGLWWTLADEHVDQGSPPTGGVNSRHSSDDGQREEKPVAVTLPEEALASNPRRDVVDVDKSAKEKAQATPYDHLSEEDVQKVRREHRAKQSAAISEFFKSQRHHPGAPTISHEQYQDWVIYGSDDVFLEKFNIDAPIEFFWVDPKMYPEIYELRDQARVIQSSKPYRAYFDRSCKQMIERLEASGIASGLNTVTSLDGGVYTVFGTVNGQSEAVGQVCCQTSN